MIDLNHLVGEYDFPEGYAERLAATIRRDGEALHSYRESLFEKAGREWLAGLEGEPEVALEDEETSRRYRPRPSIKATEPVSKVPPPMNSARWRVRRINAGKPRWEDHYARHWPNRAKVQPVAWATFGIDAEYDIVACLDPGLPWAWRVRLADPEDGPDHEAWEGGWEASEALARDKLTWARSRFGTQSGQVTQAIWTTADEAGEAMRIED